MFITESTHTSLGNTNGTNPVSRISVTAAHGTAPGQFGLFLKGWQKSRPGGITSTLGEELLSI